MSILKFSAVVCAAFLLISCGGGGGSSSKTDFDIDYYPKECSEASQTEFVYKAMHDIYLWADRVNEVDYKTFTSQFELMDAMKVSEDRYSTIYGKKMLEDYYAGSSAGLGFNTLVDGTDMYVRLVQPDSPAGKAGLRRGDRIISMNGYSAAEIQADLTKYYETYANSEVGTPVTVVYEDSQKTVRSVLLTVADFYSTSLIAYEVFERSDGKKAGYMMYLSFNENLSDTDEAFRAISDAGVDYLVVDLRYNGGGFVSTAQYFGSVIGGSGLKGLVLLKMAFNSKHANLNEFLYFTSTEYKINAEKIVFLVSGYTASASELIINGIAPFKNVYVIGSTTYGKPVGSHYIQYCDKYLSAITFRNENALGSGGYYNGMTPDCIKNEEMDSLGSFGDKNEKLLGAALSYLETGACVSEKSGKSKILTDEREIRGLWQKK